MEDSPHLYISELGEDENVVEQQQEEEEEEDEEEEDDDDDDEEIEDKESEEPQCGLSLISVKADELVVSNTPCQRPEAKFSGNLNQGLVSVSLEPQEEPELDAADAESHDSFPCQHCERHFTSRQGLERHLHIHALANHQTHTFKCKYCSKSFGSKVGRRRHERRHENARARPGSLIKPVDSLKTDGDYVSGTSCLVEGDQKSVSGKHRITRWPELQGGHACKYCRKVFSTHTNMQRHQRRLHERHLRLKGKVIQPQQTTLQKLSTSQEELKPISDSNPFAVQESKVEQEEQYMLDISSNISENLSFYIDGKIVSTSTISSCEVVEVNSGSATLVGLDAVILSPAQISQALNMEVATGNDILGQPLTKRRTATPPLLPQIKTELESESVLSSSSSSLIVSSLIETLLPHNTESTVLQKEKTVFLSPKLKQLLQTKDGLKPTLALITDGQNLCSPLSLTVLPAGSGRFKRRTGSPPNTPQQSPTSNVENTTPDQGEPMALNEPQVESNCSSPALDMSSNDENATGPPVEEPRATHVLPDSWPLSGGNSCNQQPLDLSAAVKRTEDEAPGEAVLDLSLQRKGADDLETKGDIAPQPLIKKRKPDTSMLEKVLMNEYPNLDLAGEQGLSQCGRPEEPLATDIAIVTASDMPPSAEGLLFGLALPSATLHPPPTSLTPVSVQPASPCAFALASPTSHTVLPTAPSLFTVLAPSTSSTSGLTNQPSLQVLAPEISMEPFVICTDKPINSAECELSAALPDWATANSANLVTISQPLDPSLSLPGHMFLADPSIALNTPGVHSAIGSEVPCSPALTLNDSLINSFNITSNTVLIECTIALDAPENLVPTAVTVQENTGELPVPAQMVISHVEQQQILSLPRHETVDPTILVSSIAESVTLSTTSAVISECPPIGDTHPTPVSDIKEEGPEQKEETTDEPLCPSETAPKIISTTCETPVEVEESVNDTKPQETFTKNFVCNVCDMLYHSMKELGDHVSEHSDKWPYKCEFCVLLFGNPTALLEHRSVLHGVGKIYVCSSCTKEFAYLCNLKHHQEELHPGQQCAYTEEEKGKLRPQNYNNSTKISSDTSPRSPTVESKNVVTKDEGDLDDATEELFTTIKILASDGTKPKGPDVRLGINQHYPSFKPPPFPYHNRSPAGAVASATNFTTHNIPQTFSTAIRCTKCGKSFDNMPELHKHILSCANASDKRRYTPKKNPIPLRHFAKAQNGVLASTNATNGQNAPPRASQTNRPKTNQEAPPKHKLNALNKRKKQLVQKAISQRSKAASSPNKVSSTQADEEVFVCPHCSREFTYRRSQTKHMAACPMKPKEVKKRKDGVVSFTKENNGHLRRGVLRSETKKQVPEQKTRALSSSPAKRPAILPAQTVMANKKLKTIAKRNVQTRQEPLKTAALSVVRPVNSQHQASKVMRGVKEVPINTAVVNSPRLKKDEHLPNQTQGGVAEPVSFGLQQVGTTSAVKEEQMTTQEPLGDQQDPAV